MYTKLVLRLYARSTQDVVTHYAAELEMTDAFRELFIKCGLFQGGRVSDSMRTQSGDVLININFNRYKIKNDFMKLIPEELKSYVRMLFNHAGVLTSLIATTEADAVKAMKTFISAVFDFNFYTDENSIVEIVGGEDPFLLETHYPDGRVEQVEVPVRPEAPRPTTVTVTSLPAASTELEEGVATAFGIVSSAISTGVFDDFYYEALETLRTYGQNALPRIIDIESALNEYGA